MNTHRIHLSLFLIATLILLSCGSRPAQTQETQATKTPPPPKLALQAHDGGFFSMQIPRGWQVATAGNCGDFAFVVRDPGYPLRQIFFFGEVGPVYLVEEQRQIDLQYMQMGGYPVAYIEMPTVAPLTPDNFMRQWHRIAATNVAQSFMPACPRLGEMQVISVTPQPPLIQGGSTALVRAVFAEGGNVAEGLFYATVAPLMGHTGGPGGNTGWGFLVTGITAPKREFAALQPQLIASAESFQLSPAYVSNCLVQQQKVWKGVGDAGKALSDASDIIMEGWQSRNRSDDVMSEKRSDAILGNERLYNPETGDVYEFENGFYDKYDLHRGQYEMNNLQLLEGNDYNLWTTPPQDGPRNLR
ncbi:hypothetical protein KKH27_08715 [bacterium]|nr:hypothetical protein [bacterium]MBU1983887.1 hypothetical protein [bacterium]